MKIIFLFFKNVDSSEWGKDLLDSGHVGVPNKENINSKSLLKDIYAFFV